MCSRGIYRGTPKREDKLSPGECILLCLARATSSRALAAFNGHRLGAASVVIIFRPRRQSFAGSSTFGPNLEGNPSQEFNNWVRDGTMGEDHVQVTASNQVQVMANLRSAAFAASRNVGTGNLEAVLEKVC